MRVRPDGVDLLRAARTVVDTSIRPSLPLDRQRALVAIEAAMVLAEDRLAREVEASPAELAGLEDARAALRGTLLDSLPEACRYDARLVAKALLIAAQQLANGRDAERREYERLNALLASPGAPNPSREEIRCKLGPLNQELAARIRAGAADQGTTEGSAALAYLRATTEDALMESNPAYRRSGARSGASNAPDRTALPIASPPEAPAAASVDARASGACPIDAPPASFARIGGWLQLLGAVGEAAYRPANAAFTAQANFFGWFSQRLAANPYVPIAAVEGAHQAHDLSVALADASAVFAKLALAPFRLEPRPADVTGAR